VRILFTRNKTWYPADEKAKHVYHETEIYAEKSFKEVFLFNLIGRGMIDMKYCNKENENDIPLM